MLGWGKKGIRLVFALISLTVIYSHTLRLTWAQPERLADLDAIPMDVGEWIGQEVPLALDVVIELKTASARMIRYVNQHENEVTIYISYWLNQKYGAQPHSTFSLRPWKS